MRRTALLVGLIFVVGCGKDPPGADSAKPAPKAASVPEPVTTFSREDANRTVRWVGAERERTWATIRPGNEISQKAANDQFLATLNATAGKTVRWKMPLRSISSGTVEVEPAVWGHVRETYRPRDAAVPHYSLNVGLYKPNRGAGRHLGTTVPFLPRDNDWFARAKQGDSVLVTGTIQEWAWDDAIYGDALGPRRHIMVCVWLVDLAAEKP